MIFVDTSVWISYFRRSSDPILVNSLHRLLDDNRAALAAPVKVELLAGVRADEATRLRRVLSALPIFYPSRDTWNETETRALKASSSGQRFGVADLLIATMATEHGASLWTLDSDFKRMAKLRFVKLARL
jgi:predicted nucleic acid-binding protein